MNGSGILLMISVLGWEWKIDPHRIGIMGFSAGAELASPAALFFEDFDQTNHTTTDPSAGVSSRPDFVECPDYQADAAADTHRGQHQNRL